jgi:hypothetical protein
MSAKYEEIDPMYLKVMPALVFVALGLFVLMGSARADAQQPALANTAILIIRHAEKPDSGPGLAPQGQQRAQAYVHYFENYQIDGKPRPPVTLIACADSDGSERPRLTLEPLSQAMSLPIHNKFKDKEYADLAAALQSQSRGKTILICWHHGEIPGLLAALGADPETLLHHGKWPEDVYNWVVQLRFDGNGHLDQSQVINEKLMPGDQAPAGQ